MKSVWVTDTHLGLKQHNQFWADLAEELFDEIIDYCIRNNIDNVIHLGDFFDSRKSLNILTINLAEVICEKFKRNKINLYIIRGNHDTFYKDKSNPHSLSFLKNNTYIHIIDEEPFYCLKDGSSEYDLTLVPWGYDISQIENKDTILLGHFEINGFITNTSGNEMQGAKLNKSDFNEFKQVYSGHFHTYSTQDNITYLGCPFAMTFNDINETKGYYVYDENNIQFIEFKTAPKFLRIYSDDNIDDFTITGNIIEYVFTEDFGNVKNQEIIDYLTSLNPQGLHINYKIQEDEEIIIDDEDFNVSDNKQLIREYIDKKDIPDHIDKNMLKKFVEKLENE